MPNKLEEVTGGKNTSYYWVLIIFIANILFVLSLLGWQLSTESEMRTWLEIFEFVMSYWALFFIWFFPSMTAFYLAYVKSDPIPQVFSITAVTILYLWTIWVVFTDTNSTAGIALFFIPGFGTFVAFIGYYIGVRISKYRIT